MTREIHMNGRRYIVEPGEPVATGPTVRIRAPRQAENVTLLATSCRPGAPIVNVKD